MFHPFDAGSAIPPGSRSLTFGSPSATTSLLFVGGYADVGSAVPSSNGVILDPATDGSTPIVMSEARILPTLTPLGPTRALVTGGFNAGGGAIHTAEIFDQATRAFTTTIGELTVGLGGHAAAVLPDGRVLLTGGIVEAGAGPPSWTTTSQIYDPALDLFDWGPDMVGQRADHSAIALDDGRVLVIGGYPGATSAEVFDPTAPPAPESPWTSGDFTLVVGMSTDHGPGHAAVKLQEGRVLVLGGEGAAGEASAVAEMFDPATDSFTRLDDMTTARRHHYAVVLPNGEVLIGGGEDADGNLLASAEIYDPVADTFTAIEDMPVAGKQQAAVPWTAEVKSGALTWRRAISGGR